MRLSEKEVNDRVRKAVPDFVKAMNLTFVPRWTIVPMLRTQTVAEHSFRVAMIRRMLAVALLNRDEQDAPFDSPEVSDRVALLHDIHEGITSDLPAPLARVTLKRGECDEMTEVADVMEALHWLTVYGVNSPLKSRVIAQIQDDLAAMPFCRKEPTLVNFVLRVMSDGIPVPTAEDYAPLLKERVAVGVEGEEQ